MASKALTALVLLAPSFGWAADRATTDRLRDLEAELGTVGSELDDTRLNFTERSGLIGVSEARRRYEDAVYAFLVGDFESAATGFYILVQSRALGNADLARDSEWYLAECLFEMGNYRTAEEAFRFIIEKGTTHPYFADAVRRNLEVYGILNDDEGFTSVYNTYIVSGKVPATELVNYTLAKAFVRRKELPRAKSMFDAIPPSSSWYTRSRYQLGVLMITEGNLKQAIAEFQKVEAAPVADEDQKRVFELSLLALGRLHYETGDFAKASDYYSRVGKDSPEFADRLYEAVWSYVKQASIAESTAAAAAEDSRERELAELEADARWADALGQVDIFLTSYPEHRFTAQLKVLEGHLHMKLHQYDEARASYEEVVAAYTPVAARLDELSGSTTDAKRFLQRMGDTGGTSGLPSYAVEVLLDREEVGRAIQAYLETTQQVREVEQAERDVAELQTALSSEGDSLGMFVAARNQLSTMRGAALAMRGRLLDAEIQYLKSKSSGAARTELAAIARELAKVQEASNEVDASLGRTTDRLQVYESQVREVQQRAFRIQQVAEEAAASGRSLAEVLGSGSSKLPPSEQERVRTELEAARAELARALVDLESSQSEVTRRRIMRTVDAGTSQENSSERSTAMAKYTKLRERVATYRRGAQDIDSSGVFAQIDRIWGQLDAVESSSGEAVQVVSAGEARETAAVRQRLASAAEKVVQLRRDIDSGAVTTEAVATRAVLSGLSSLQLQFESDVIDADKGIVDVYWLRKADTDEEQDLLVEQQAKLLQELNDRFRVIRENLDR